MTTGYWLAIGAGGALGALARAGVALVFTGGGGFPMHTFIANVMGSFAIGLVWAALQRLDTSPIWSAFLITGVLGGFTTFSSFSLETLLLLEEGAWRTALWYVTLSISTCVLGAWLGVWIVRAAL